MPQEKMSTSDIKKDAPARPNPADIEQAKAAKEKQIKSGEPIKKDKQ